MSETPAYEELYRLGCERLDAEQKAGRPHVSDACWMGQALKGMASPVSPTGGLVICTGGEECTALQKGHELRARYSLNGVTESTQRVVRDVALERMRQRDLGYTDEHDDRRSIHELIEIAKRLFHKTPRGNEDGFFYRSSLLKATAVLVAAVESMDRRRLDGD